MEIGLDAWEKFDSRQGRIILDHELCHFAGQDDHGRWGRAGHDVEEFTAILKRHGLWSAELEVFVTAARQRELPLSA